MTPEQFRTAGHQLVDWIADYRTDLESHPVRAQTSPGDVAMMPGQPPESLDEMADLLGDLDSIVVPGSTLVQHPMYFGWFPANATLSSVLGDIASSGLGNLGISWESCPALTEVEQVVCDWLRQLVGLSDRWHGTIHDTASTSCLTALLAARERATSHSQVGPGLAGVDAPPVAYATAQAHSSIRKGALLAGYGADQLVVVDDDPWTRAMDVGDLEAKMNADMAAGRCPAVVVAGVGTTATAAFDPVASIVEVARKYNAWVHVDAAMAGTAMLVPECRFLWEGVEGADSISWNPHKWMGTVLDTSMFLVRDVEHLVRVMSTNPSYLMSSADGQVIQYRDWGIPLGRRFRALKIWFQLRLDGVESIQQRIRRDLDNAAVLAELVESGDGWEVVAPVQLQTVCVRHRPSGLGPAEMDKHTLGWVGAINDSGLAYLTPSVLDGEWMVRVSIGAESTERSHVDALWAIMQKAVANQDLGS